MNFINKKIRLLRWNVPVAAVLWLLLSIIAVTAELARDSIGNYKIFQGVFWHTLHQTDLYALYPDEYQDSNHYGPFFSLVIMPFALLPKYIGCFLWVVANTLILLYAIKSLNLGKTNTNIILWVAGVELMTAAHNVQFNPMMTAWIILSFSLVKKEKDIWATLFIAAGFMVKLYGIVGLAFFLFSRHKLRFVLSFALWMVVLFVLPMLLAGPEFIINSYKGWFHSLAEKNNSNAVLYNMQDFSVMGLIRRLFTWPGFSGLYVMAPAAICLGLPLLNFKKLSNPVYQLLYLSVLLISVVIFSSSAESATYIIAMTGVGIWFVTNEKNKWTIALLVIAIVFTSLSTTDLFPRAIKKGIIHKYAIKALPCFLVWLYIIYRLLFTGFNKTVLKDA
jgi:hypothetical protein